MELGKNHTGEEAVAEFTELVVSAGATPVSVVRGVRHTPDARFFVGSGKVREIAEKITQFDAELAIFNQSLSPAQERNLERALNCRVLDRTSLILDIFAQRASSFEGKLQVELAQLNHLATRLVRGWTHLERQKGGIGLRGPGEAQLETDRRLIAKRIAQINTRLARVENRRQHGRKLRHKVDLPTVALVGYTNAGKSSLFNRLTGADVYVADQLFATLDPTLRRVDLEGIGPVIVSDTVGFISDLPHHLIAAFRATLEETKQADLLLHVVDANAPDQRMHIDQVEEVLFQIGAETVPIIEVHNKIDLVDGVEPRIERGAFNKVRRVWIAARTGDGLDLLKQAVAEHFYAGRVRCRLNVPLHEARYRSEFYKLEAVIDEQIRADGSWLITVSLANAKLNQIVGNSDVSVVEELASPVS